MMVAGLAAAAGVVRPSGPGPGPGIDRREGPWPAESRDLVELMLKAVARSRLYLDAGHGWDLSFGWIG